MASALGAFKLSSADRNERLAAAAALAGGADAAMLPLIRKALEKETDPEIKALLDMTAAGMEIKSGDKDVAPRRDPHARRARQSRTPRRCSLEAASDPDEDIRREAQQSLRAIEGAPRAGANGSGSPSPACRSARSCCSPRSASPSPTA